MKNLLCSILLTISGYALATDPVHVSINEGIPFKCEAPEVYIAFTAKGCITEAEWIEGGVQQDDPL